MKKTEVNKQIEQGLRPFKLVKYFSFSSLAVIMLFTLLLSWVISNQSRTSMLKQSGAYSRLLAENLNQQVFRGFVVPAVLNYGKIALSNPDQFKRLDTIIRNVTQGLKINKITIYDSSINVISYSTDQQLVGKLDVGGIEYKKALKGESNSQIVSSGGIWNLFPSTAAVHCQLKTYIPFRQVSQSGESGDVIMGVIEVVQDLSEEYGAIVHLQGRIIFFSTLVMAVLFLVLRTIVSQADRIMEKRAKERLRLEEKLNKSERLASLGTMVATVSHEIKSPLGIVRSTAEILEKRIRKVAPGNEHLARIIIDETKRLNGIVMKFLDFARPQEPKFIQVDINALIGRTLMFIEQEIKQRSLHVACNLAQDLRQVGADPDLLYRVLLNIMVNSMQAMEEDGHLSLVTKSDDSEKAIRIIISDTGKGIALEDIDQIFKPFFTNKNKGTGLGLAISRNIIESHNGTITVESVEGEGSVFTILLPW